MNLPAVKMPDVRQTVVRSICVLAACAAVASFSHIYSFARAAGQPALIALLYPGSTDVLVACAIACLLHASRNKELSPVFPRWAFAAGVAATVAANIGDHFRPIPFPVGAVVSGWPAVSFVLAVMLGHWFWNAAPKSEREPEKTAQRYVTGSEASSNDVTEASRDGGSVTGNPPVPGSKTELVRAELQKRRAAGKDPGAAELVASLLEQGHEISATLARNVVRDSKVSSNGHTS